MTVMTVITLMTTLALCEHGREGDYILLFDHHDHISSTNNSHMTKNNIITIWGKAKKRVVPGAAVFCLLHRC